MEQRIVYYSKAIQLNPKFYNAYLNRAEVLRSLKLYDQAIADCNSAVAIDPQKYPAYKARGLVYLISSQFVKTIQDYNQVITFGYQDADVYDQRGFSYYKLGKYAEAVQDYKQALALNPTHSKAAANLKSLKEKLGDVLPDIPKQPKTHALVGMWGTTDNGGEFKANGSFCKYQFVDSPQLGIPSSQNNQYGRYTANGHYISLYWDNYDPDRFYFQISGNTLILNDVTYERSTKPTLTDEEISERIVGTWQSAFTPGGVNPNLQYGVMSYMKFYPKQYGQKYGRVLKSTSTFTNYNPGSFSGSTFGEGTEQYNYYVSERSLILVNPLTNERESYDITYIDRNHMTMGGRSWSRQK